MKPITEFIIEIKKSHRDEVTLKNGLTLHLDVKYNQGEHVNVLGIVIAVPELYDTDIKIGDTVIIDRNMVTFQVHSDHLINKSGFLVDEKKGHYRVEPSMIYLYKTELKDEWKCPVPYVFVSPIPYEDVETNSGLIYTERGYKGNKEQHGCCVYLNEDIRKELSKGDVVFFKKDREYEFYLDGEVLYHMENSDLLALIKEV